MAETHGAAESPGSNSTRWAYAVERVIILAALLYVLSGLYTVVAGDSAFSRLATVYSLTHDGTWFIDRPPDGPPNPFEPNTIDKVEFNGRILSTKPPLLPLAMTGEYVLLHRFLGWDLETRDELRQIVRVMILTLDIIPYFAGLVFFALLLDLLVANPWRRLPPLFALAFATQVPGFAAQLNNHTPAIACLTVALYFAIGLCSGKLAPAWWRFLGFGLTGALVFTLDMPLTVFVAIAGCGLLWKFPRPAVAWGAAGMAVPLILHFGIMLYVTGSPLPIQMHKDLYLYEGSAWRHPGGIDALNEPKGTYLFHMSFGRYGVFLLYPILLLGPLGFILGMGRAWARWRPYFLGGALGIALLTFYYVKSTNNYGGAAYGFRWGMGAMPVLLLMGIPAFERLRRPWAWAAVSLLMAVSMFSTWECYREPWGDSHEWPSRWIFGAPYRF